MIIDRTCASGGLASDGARQPSRSGARRGEPQRVAGVVVGHVVVG